MNRMTTAILLAAAAVSQATYATPADAVGWAITHQSEVIHDSRPFWRYVWIPQHLAGKKYDERHVAAAISYAVNEAASQTATIVRPKRIANGWMVAIYLPHFASHTKPSPVDSRKTELHVLMEVWDSLAETDPYFHEHSNNSGEHAAVAARHIPSAMAINLAGSMNSPALVYRADWLLTRLLHHDYYRFMQFGKTQPDVYRSIGVDEKLVKQVEGDQRTALFVSNVTGKPRRGDRLQGPGGRYNTGAVFQTWDVSDEQDAVKNHPLYNLLAFRPAGGEAIFERPNGMHGYILYDGRRNLVAEAPPELVSDHSIPGPPGGPGTRRLAPAISCIRCHAAGEGLLPFANDVQRLVKSGIDILGDLSQHDQQATVLRLAGLYMGDFDRRLVLARDDYDRAIRQATAYAELPGGMGAREAGECIAHIYGQHEHQLVSPAQACREIGRDPGNDPAETLRQQFLGRLGDNVVMAALKTGLPVRRRDWEQVYSAAMTEARR